MYIYSLVRTDHITIDYVREDGASYKSSTYSKRECSGESNNLYGYNEKQVRDVEDGASTDGRPNLVPGSI